MPGCRFPLRKHSIFFAEKNIFKLEACNFCEHPCRKRTSHETPYKKSKPSPKPGFYHALKPKKTPKQKRGFNGAKKKKEEKKRKSFGKRGFFLNPILFFFPFFWFSPPDR